MGKKFDLGDSLAAVLGAVSNSDTGEDRIEYIDIYNLDADKENFYSMDGIDELAANIELIGLQQPLRVRENSDMPGRYLIVSGHRRRAALWTLYEETPEKWGRVPCIVEQPAESPEMQELRLIFANAATRQMSSADLSRQAERVEMLLYRLAEQGVEFPGRMRDHVAAACKVSATKIATLTAIRNNLIPELKTYYEKNEINESCAYELQKLPAEGQKAIADSCKRTGATFIKGWACERCVELADKYMAAQKCENGDDCNHHAARFVKTLRAKTMWDYCPGGCCVSCRDLMDCDHACKKAKEKKAETKAEDKANKEKQKIEADKQQKKELQKKCKMRREQAQRVLPLIEAAGLSDGDELEGQYFYSKVKVSEIRKAAAGDFGDRNYYYGDDHLIIPKNVETLAKWADKLGCTLDFLAGRTEKPAPAAAPETPPQFRSGKKPPTEPCLCWCVFDCEGTHLTTSAEYWPHLSKWAFKNGASIDAECVGWFPLPDYEGVLRK